MGYELPATEESLTPIYPTTEGMHHLTWRAMTDKALALLEERPQSLPEWLPEQFEACIPAAGSLCGGSLSHRLR